MASQESEEIDIFCDLTFKKLLRPNLMQCLYSICMISHKGIRLLSWPCYLFTFCSNAQTNFGVEIIEVSLKQHPEYYGILL